MKDSLRLILFILLITNLSAAPFVVIAHKDMPRLSSAQIKAVFLKKRLFLDGVTLVPLNLGVKDPLRHTFEKQLLHMGFSRLKSYWSRQHYLGHRPPLSMHSQESVIAFVQKVEGSMGYIDEAHLTPDLHVIYRWEGP